jgi:type VI secretion system protein ImpB
MASSDSGQKFIKRNRPPRVQISYEDPYDAEKQVELPFVMGIMADLSGNASKVEKPAMADRKFTNVDMDNFEEYMDSVQPAVTFRVDNKLSDQPGEKMGVNLTFKKMSDFDPAGIARQVPALKALLEAREQLANLQRYMDGKVAAEDKLKELLSSPELMKALQDRRNESASEETSGEDAEGKA